MRIRIALAVSLSVILIALAVWIRLGVTTNSGELIAVKSEGVQTSTPIGSNLSFQNSTSTEINLTNTEIISRQLLSDYINLVGSGEITDSNINLLAEKYIESIPIIQAGFYTPMKLADLKTSLNTSPNFKTYEETMRKIHEKYGAQMKSIYPGNTILGNDSSETYPFLADLSQLYSNMASEIKEVITPVEISPYHLRLVNNYLSTAGAMISLSTQTKTDPITTIAAITTLRDNMEAQGVIIAEINQILMKNEL
jgi:hypothetical protein